MVEEELDETIHWLEIISDTGMLPESRIEGLCAEARQLYKIIVSSIITTKSKMSRIVD